MTREGTLSVIIFQNPENAYLAAVLDTEEGSCKIAGNIIDPGIGKKYRMEGEEEIHHKYGKQFHFTSYEELLPDDWDAVYEFLCSGKIKGIGPKKAEAIMNVFGEESLEILEEDPDRFLEVPGIGEKSLAVIVESFKESREFYYITVELRKLGIEMNDLIRIYKEYGSETIEKVYENPYALSEIHNISFRKADEIAIKIGMSSDNELRIEHGVRYILNTDSAREGHLFLPLDKLTKETVALLGIPDSIVSNAIYKLIEEGRLKDDIINDIHAVYIKTNYENEDCFANKLISLRDCPIQDINAEFSNLINDAEENLNISLSPGQKKAVLNSLSKRVSIITGGPGTGKTTILKVLVWIFDRLEKKVALAAPTGRAADRMQESVGRDASTIHRLLECYPLGNSSRFKFNRNEDNPLKEDVVIVDEVSMLDMSLACSLIRATAIGTRVIFVGDRDQLPSVGAGNVLHDMISSECIHTSILTDIFRQEEGSKIITNSHLINQGKYPELSDDFIMIRKNSDKAILDIIKELVGGRMVDGLDCINSVDDIQILTPGKKGLLGSYSLNTELQEVINPIDEDKPEIEIGGRVFRLGDRVMQFRNNYAAEWRDSKTWAVETGVFNGEIGKVIKVSPEDKTMTVEMGRKIVKYEGIMFDDVGLAYSITIHKSQGGEFPAVIIPAWKFPRMLLTRKLLYTAVTRASKIVVIVGEPAIVKTMIDNDRFEERYTGLKARLCKASQTCN